MSEDPASGVFIFHGQIVAATGKDTRPHRSWVSLLPITIAGASIAAFVVTTIVFLMDEPAIPNEVPAPVSVEIPVPAPQLTTTMPPPIVIDKPALFESFQRQIQPPREEVVPDRTERRSVHKTTPPVRTGGYRARPRTGWDLYMYCAEHNQPYPC